MGTREPQYNNCIELANSYGPTRLGLMSNQVWHDDPRRLTFVLARYKFVSKMLSGSRHVLEVGCADGFGTRVVLQEVQRVTAVDFDPLFVDDARNHMNDRWKFDCKVHDMLAGPVEGEFDGAYALDVIEHIPRKDEDVFIRNMIQSLTPHGVLLIGSPSSESQTYASPASKEGHVNCKNGPEMKTFFSRFFHNVFLFSMNDEVVHTGFYPMAHYLFALCCGKRGQ